MTYIRFDRLLVVGCSGFYIEVNSKIRLRIWLPRWNSMMVTDPNDFINEGIIGIPEDTVSRENLSDYEVKVN